MDNGHPTTLFNRSARESGRKLKLLALENLRDVKIEEVAVEDGLDTSGNDGDDVVEPLDVVSVDPVEDIEAAVGAESEEIVAGDGLSLASLADHEELGEDGDALQVDGEGPEDLHDTELVVEDQSQEDARSEEELHSEGVVIPVVSRLNNSYINCVIGFNYSPSHLKFHIHQIDGPSSAADEENLHDGVVERDEAGDEVEVPRDEDHQEEDLRFPGYSGTASCLPYLEEEEDYRQQVGQVSEQTENVHLL